MKIAPKWYPRRWSLCSDTSILSYAGPKVNRKMLPRLKVFPNFIFLLKSTIVCYNRGTKSVLHMVSVICSNRTDFCLNIKYTEECTIVAFSGHASYRHVGHLGFYRQAYPPYRRDRQSHPYCCLARRYSERL